MTARRGRRYRLLGTTVEIACGDDAVAARLDVLLAPFHTGDAADQPVPARFSIAPVAEGRSRLQRGFDEVVEGPDDLVLARLVAELNKIALARCPQLALHAGVVADRGRAIAFPGASGAGKTTLTAACVREGFDYVSDEALCLDRDAGTVVPYPKPLALSAPGADLVGIETTLPAFTDLLLRAEDLGGRRAEANLRLAHVVVIERGGTEAALEPLPASEVVVRLLRFAFNHYRDPAGSFRLAVAEAASCRAWRLRYDDPCDAAALLRAELIRAVPAAGEGLYVAGRTEDTRGAGSRGIGASLA